MIALSFLFILLRLHLTELLIGMDVPGCEINRILIHIHICDVVIAIKFHADVAARQTREFGTTFEEEISLLLVHGLLHLCGYDHIADDEAEVMERREAEILEAWAKR